MFEGFGPVTEEVIEATHPQKWIRADRIFEIIQENRPIPFLTTKSYIPLAPTFIKPGPEKYGLKHRRESEGFVLAYRYSDSHVMSLLYGLTKKKVLELRSQTKLTEGPWVDPPIEDVEAVHKFAEEQQAILEDLKERDPATYRMLAHDAAKYGVGGLYFRLTAEGMKLKSATRESVGAVVGKTAEA